MNWAATIWMVLMLGFLIVEGACPFHLVSIWFAAGALVAGIAALLHAALWLQITLFFVVSIALLIAMFPLVKKVMNPKITKTNVDSVVGAQGYVTETVDNLAATGQVKLGSMPWTARSTDGSPIEKGTLVRVDRIEGVKAYVSPVKESVIYLFHQTVVRLPLYLPQFVVQAERWALFVHRVCFREWLPKTLVKLLM